MTRVVLVAIFCACLYLAMVFMIPERARPDPIICYGFDLYFDLKDTPEVRLEMLKELTNCTLILGNLDIVGMPPGADLSFLHSIEEVRGRVLVYDLNADRIPLPNLILIRGDSSVLITVNRTLNPIIGNEGWIFLLIVVGNPGLIHLGLNNLTELAMGNPGFLGNPHLCYEERAPWSEIYGEGEFYYLFEGGRHISECLCHPKCPMYDGYSNCFGPYLNDCYNIRGDCHGSCAENRCYGLKEGECCNYRCSVACSGPGSDQCHTCKFAGLGDYCYLECPKDKWETYYKYANRCVTKCPEDHVIMGDECVRFCGPNYMEFEGRCVPCEEGKPCKRRCLGTGLSFITIRIYDNFTTCTTIVGNLYVADRSFRKLKYLEDMKLYMLQSLIDVETITGSLYVDVHRDEFKNLSFLRNLKVIEARTSVNGFTGLMIENTTMESIGLTSLKEVSRGRIVITGNKDLCYLNGLDLNLLGKSKDHLMEDNKAFESCAKEKKVCAEACRGGCMGPLDSDCVWCNGYKKDGKCVICHDKCLTCSGPGPDDCVTCPKFHLFKDDKLKCVDTCPPSIGIEQVETLYGTVSKICIDKAEEERRIANELQEEEEEYADEAPYYSEIRKPAGGRAKTVKSGTNMHWIIIGMALCLIGISSLAVSIISSLKRAKPPKADVQKGEKEEETQSSKEQNYQLVPLTR